MRRNKNQVVDHLTKLEARDHMAKGGMIRETFPDEILLAITSEETLWYVDYVNYITIGVLPPELEPHAKEKFLHDVRLYV